MLGHVLEANMTNNVVFLEVLSLKDMMNGESGRRIEPQHLRETILRAAIPLIPGWDAVTTAQIARAAGIDEVTFLDVFSDKDAVILALSERIMIALDPTQVVQDLQAIRLDQPVAVRLIKAINALDAYRGRAATVLAVPDTSGAPRRQPPSDRETADEPRTGQLDRDDFRSATRLDIICDAVTKLLEPDQENLRYSCRILAGAFIGLYSGGQQNPQPEPSQLSAEQLVDLFLHGTMTATN